MTSRLNPYLSFNGNAREAAEFYRSVFGGELTVSTHGEFGNPDPAMADKVMHGQLETDADRLRQYFEKLSDGGTVTMPLEKQMWGDEFGMCTDRFGVSWMVNIGQPQS
jgi:PhnB protein